MTNERRRTAASSNASRKPSVSANSNRKPSAAASARRKPSAQANAERGASAKKRESALYKLFKPVIIVFAALYIAVSTALKRLNRVFDVFRKGEASAIIVNACLSAAALTLVIILFIALLPGIQTARARALAQAGRAEDALRLLRNLEADDIGDDKLLIARRDVAAGLISSGKYDEALALIAELPKHAAAETLSKRANYGKAALLYDAKRYSDAALLFDGLDKYEDSAQRYIDCVCALAIQAYMGGDEARAHQLLLSVSGASEHIERAAKHAAGGDAAARRILATELFSIENLRRMESSVTKLSQKLSDIPKGRIAAGFKHTLALTSNGTVLAAGGNQYGQTNVSGWTGITQLAAGAYHSVGLRSNGTVVATGLDTDGQCQVSGWTGIIAVSASAYDTIGLKSDGTVLISGRNAGKADSWRDAIMVAGGSYSCACLYGQGMMRSTHTGAQLPIGSVFLDMSVCGAVSAGILSDGTLVASIKNAPDWTGLMCVTVCEAGILGIDTDGKLKSHFYRASDNIDFAFTGAAVEVESSGTHHVVLTEDGRVYAFGLNDSGQCAVSGWRL